MKIQIGDICMEEVELQKLPYSNKTKMYLLPCLKEYGRIFMHRINSVFKVAIGVGDIVLKNRGIKHEKHLFILINTKLATEFFETFILWVRDQPMYEDDYTYSNLTKSHYHMVVLKFPENLHDSLDKFHRGEYSKMFSKERLAQFFENFPESQRVLIKDHNYKMRFVGKLNKEFKLIGKHAIKPSEYEGEYDLPPSAKTEVFNNHLKR